MNRERSYAGGPRVPVYPEAPWRDAAKHLRLTVTRFLVERATFDDVEQAMEMLRRVTCSDDDR